MLDRGRFVNAESEFDIENGMPAMRGVVTARHGWGPFDLMLRMRLFGKYKNAKTTLLEDIQAFDPGGDGGRGGGVDIPPPLPASRLVCKTCSTTIRRRRCSRHAAAPFIGGDSIVPWQGQLVYLQMGSRFD